MRKKQYLVNPKVKIKEFKVNDFSNITDCAINVKISDKLCSNDITLKFVCLFVDTMIKSYYIGDRFFAYMKDNTIYEYKNKRMESVLKVSSQPLLIDILVNGIKEILVVEINGAYILKKDITFNFPYGQCIAKHKGRLFVADGKNIYFSNQFNFTVYSTNIENQGFISVDDNAGKILDLIEYKDSLMVVCEKAIYKLRLIDQNFEFDKIELDYVDILPNSAKKVGDKIYFISQNKLCEFDGSSRIMLNGDFDRFLPLAKEFATSVQGLYSIKVAVNGRDVFLVYDTSTKEHYYVWTDGVGNMGENGYVFVEEFGTIYRINANTNNQTYEWQSKDIDFESLNKKALLELRLTVDQPMALYIQGDFGTKEIQLSEGVNIKKLNLTSRAFKMRIYQYANTLLVKDLSLKYKIVGE